MDVILQWIVAHQGVVAGLGVGIFDFVFAVSPKLESNGIIHAFYLWVKGLVVKPKE